MPKKGVSYIKPEEPKFLREMKRRIGYQEPDTVETKKQSLPVDAADDVPEDDEKPIVVVLKPGDLTEEEFEKETSEKADLSKRVVFSKPVKRESSDKNPLVCSSKKSREDLEKRVKMASEKGKKVKNSSLLSFDEDEDENG